MRPGGAAFACACRWTATWSQRLFYIPGAMTAQVVPGPGSKQLGQIIEIGGQLNGSRLNQAVSRGQCLACRCWKGASPAL